MKKRIALAVVTALGAGVLVAAPASATDGITSVTLAGPVRAGVGGVNVLAAGTGTQTYAADADGAGAGTNPAIWIYVNTTKPTAAASAGFTAVTSSTDLATSGGAIIGTATPTVEGAYTGYVYFDADGSATLSPGELSAIFNFTTTGIATGIAASAAKATLGATVANTVTVNLNNAAGALTQSVAGEFVTVSALGTGAITLAGAALSSISNGAAAAASTASIAYGQFVDGTAAFTAASSLGSDTVTITITPSLALQTQGATAKTVTFTTVANTTSTAIKSAVAAGANIVATDSDSWIASTNVLSFSFVITGLGAGAAVAPTITQAAGTFNVDGVAYTSGAALPRIADANGSLTLVVTPTNAAAAANTVNYVLDANGATANGASQVNADLTYTTPAYTTAFTAPSVATTLQQSGTAVVVSGTSKDQWGNPAAGNVVAVTGTATGGTNRTATVVVGTDGLWTATLAAVDAATTVLSVDVDTTGAISDTEPGAPRVVNFSATGLPTAGTLVAGLANGTAVGNQTTTVPALVLPTDGSVSTIIVDDYYTLPTASVAGAVTTGAGADSAEYVQLTTTTDPMGADITLVGSAGVSLKAGTAPFVPNSGASTVSVKAGTAVYAWATTPGVKTVTMTSGTVSKTVSFYVAAAPVAAARNVSVSGAASLVNGNVSTYTVTVTDAFGNPVKDVSTLTASVVGLGFINGSLTSQALANTDAAGQSTFQLVAANSGAGTVTVTVAGTGNQFDSAAGSITTTAGTNGFAAAVGSSAKAVTIAASTVKDAATLAAEAAKAAAEKAGTDAVAAAAAAAAAAAKAGTDAVAAAATAKAAADAAAAAAAKAGVDAAAAAAAAGVKADAATAAAKAASDAVAALSTSVASLQTTVASLVASMTAQIKVINSSMLKIAKKLGIKI